MKPALLITARLLTLLALTTPLAAASALGGECEDRCASSYDQCAQSTASGCEVGSALVGKAAEQLGGQIPIPGLGKLLGAAAAGITAEECKQKLAPCEEVRTNCLAECAALAAQAQPGAPMAPARKVGTLRVFSDHPRTRVYINDQRMGVTTDDPEQPFVSPELAVGKYWIHLTTPDGRWQWEGVKELDEGNVNAIEGALVDVVARRAAEREEAWQAARTVDQRGLAEQAIAAYGAFVQQYPDDPQKCSVARDRISELQATLAHKDDETFALILGTNHPETRASLCQAYLEQFPQGRHRVEVEAIVAEVARARSEPEAFAAIGAAIGAGQRIALGEQYLATYPAGPNRAAVEQLIAAARDELEQAAREQQAAEEAKRPLRIAGGVTLGVGLASLLTAGILGGVSWAQYDELTDQCACWKTNQDVGSNYDELTDPSYECACASSSADQAARIESMALSADVLLGVGGALTIAGTIMLIVARPSGEDPPPVSVALGPLANEGGAIRLGWSF